MKILITGASGFIGNYVVEQLVNSNHTLILCSRQPLEKNSWNHADIQWKYLNLEEDDSSINYYKYFNEPDICIHMAWSGLPQYTQLFHFEKNLPQQYTFLKNLIENGLQSLTVTGTCFEYGMQQGELREDLPSQPANAYALSKYTLYCFLIELQKHIPFNLSWLRLFYMFGKGQNERSLFTQLNAALERGDVSFNMSGGEQIRDFLLVEDVSRYITAIALKKTNCGIINCCSGNPIKVKDWVSNYVQQQGKKIDLNLGYYPYVSYEPMSFWGSIKKLRQVLT